MENEKIYIFGHRKPDTDSVAAAISLSYLKNKLGFNTEPRILSDTNPESKFVLDYFNVTEPRYLNDVKVEIKDVNYHRDYFINAHNSIYKCYLKMCELGVTMLPIVNDNQDFVGMIGMKNIAKEEIFNSDKFLDSSYDNIVEALKGKEICKFDTELKGNVLVASYETNTFINDVTIDNDTILIVGNRNDILEYVLNKKLKLVILTGGFSLNEKCLELAKKNNINIISTEYDTFKAANMISLCNYLKNAMMTDEIVCFNQNDELNSCLEIANKVKYTNYPVVDKHNKCLGMLRLSDISDATRKKVILVDHNEYIQSVDGIEEAEILEIVDHHKIGNLDTKYPIAFRNMPVGSTNTIIYSMFKENNIEIPSNIAGVMLSGIISDTLLFRSPTTTNKDKEAVFDLADIAGVDYEKYGMEMLKAGSSLKNKTKEEILYYDFKNFNVNNKKIGIGQILTMTPNDVLDELNEYVSLVNEVAEHNDNLIIALFVTDILNNGSYIIYNESAQEILSICFDKEDLCEGMFLKDYISRKKQIIPNIIDVLEKR